LLNEQKNQFISNVKKKENQILSVYLNVILLPLGVSIRDGNLKSAPREYERFTSFLHGLGSVLKREGRFLLVRIIIIFFLYLVVVFVLLMLFDDLVDHQQHDFPLELLALMDYQYDY